MVCPSTPRGIYFSYTYNEKLAYESSTNFTRKMSVVQLPAQTPAFADGAFSATAGRSLMFSVTGQVNDGFLWNVNKYQGASTNVTGIDGGSEPVQQGSISAGRHLEGANYLFVDGHVKWLKPLPGDCKTAHANEWIPPKKDLDYDGDGIVGPVMKTLTTGGCSGSQPVWD